MRIADAILPWCFGLAIIGFGVGFYQALIVAPADYQQGETVRIMYVHAPSAYMGMMMYGVMASASFVFLVWRHPLADMSAKAAAPIGASYTAIALVTGSLWGQPMWGTWWVWDARLTSFLILFFFYIGYMALGAAIDDRQKASRAAAILALVGAVNLPIIKFSVEWWNTLHQPASLIRADGPSMPMEMLLPLFVMLFAVSMLAATMLIWRIKGELATRKLEALRYLRASEAGP